MGIVVVSWGCLIVNFPGPIWTKYRNSRTLSMLTLHRYSSNSVVGGERTSAPKLSRCSGLSGLRRVAAQNSPDDLEAQTRPLLSGYRPAVRAFYTAPLTCSEMYSRCPREWDIFLKNKTKQNETLERKDLNIYQTSWENRLVKLRNQKRSKGKRRTESVAEKGNTYWRQQVSSKPGMGAVLCAVCACGLLVCKVSQTL